MLINTDIKLEKKILNYSRLKNNAAPLTMGLHYKENNVFLGLHWMVMTLAFRRPDFLDIKLKKLIIKVTGK